MHKRAFLIVFIIISSLLFVDCQGGKTKKSKSNKSLDISVYYRERIMLPHGSELTVSLADVSKMDVAAEFISSYTEVLEGAPPFEISLNYDSKKLNKKGRYVVRAVIKNNKQLLFTSTEHIEAFENSNDNRIEVMVRSIEKGPAKLSQGNVPLENTYWKLISLNDNPVNIGSDEKALYIQFLDEESRVAGYSGCNNYAGGYELQKDSLSFGMMMSTKKMCVETMDLEQEYLLMLSNTIEYSIEYDKLNFYNVARELIAAYQVAQKPE